MIKFKAKVEASVIVQSFGYYVDNSSERSSSVSSDGKFSFVCINSYYTMEVDAVRNGKKCTICTNDMLLTRLVSTCTLYKLLSYITCLLINHKP